MAGCDGYSVIDVAQEANADAFALSAIAYP
jgi:hypothetical protein